MRYHELEIDYILPDNLRDTIAEYVLYLNTNHSHLDADLYALEIQSILNGCDADLTDEQYWELCDYYVCGGIFRHE